MIMTLARILSPPRCVYCNADVRHGYCCARCNRLLPRVISSCERCAGPLPASGNGTPLCGECQVSPPPFDRTRAVFEYAFPVDAALKSLKFRSRLFFAPAFSAALLHAIDEDFPDADALVPVPLHRWRYASRGFNQARDLCRPLARSSGLPMLRNVHRVRPTATQTGLNAPQRRRNLSGAFRVRGRLRSVRPLIVDDVMTTGETCRQLAITLLEAGAGSVGVLVVARA
jgi:ComF family protein